MSIIGIVAVDRRGAIGKGGAIPWHYSSDLKFFRRQTTGHACLMGYRTWLSLGRPLKQRLNIVLSRASDITPTQQSVVLLRDRDAVLSLRPYLACDIYVIGGAQVYRAFLDDIDRWLVTQIPLEVEGADTFMPHDFLRGFSETDSIQLEEKLRVAVYERDAPSSAPEQSGQT